MTPASQVALGTASRSSGGLTVAPLFLDPRTGEETSVEPVWVRDEGETRAAAEAIVAQLERPPPRALPWLLFFGILLLLGLRLAWWRGPGSAGQGPGGAARSSP